LVVVDDEHGVVVFGEGETDEREEDDVDEAFFTTGESTGGVGLVFDMCMTKY
jgi:hypothetical protein